MIYADRGGERLAGLENGSVTNSVGELAWDNIMGMARLAEVFVVRGCSGMWFWFDSILMAGF
jgi:hypothetical protein